MDYPKMIYRGGDLAGEQLTVENEAEEASAEKGGFWAHDRKSKKPSEPAAPIAPAEPAKVQSIETKPKGKPGPKPKGKVE